MADQRDEHEMSVSNAHLVDRHDFNLIPDMVTEAILFDHSHYGDSGTDLSPAEALEAIRRDDLSSFDWVPRDDEEMRDFFSRYMPFSALQSLMRLDEPDFRDSMGAWKPGSPWTSFFETLISNARVGAVKAYEAILSGRSGPPRGRQPAKPKRKRRTPAAAGRAAKGFGSAASRHKGVKTIQ